MNCRKCGYPLPNSARFCPNCGARTKHTHPAVIVLLSILSIALILGFFMLLLIPMFFLMSDSRPDDPEPAFSANGNPTPAPGYTDSSSSAIGSSREPYTVLAGDGSDTVTLMFYIVGSDLESQDNSASDDIREIMDCNGNPNVNLIIQTGGAKHWGMREISRAAERFAVEDGELISLGEVGNYSMAQKGMLSDFITFSAKNYPADRYAIILWNHGGGTMEGFGWDEIYDDSISLAHLDDELSTAGVKFDFVGFDACLMATLETAYMLESHADYMIASEESEPGDGWYYTDWLNSLCANPSVDTQTLGKQIVDDFVNFYTRYDETTLSLVDLTKIKPVYTELLKFMQESEKIMLENASYTTFSGARANARAYGEGEYDQIDIIDYVQYTGLESGNELCNAVNSSVIYHNGCVPNSHGLSMYFPYSEVSEYDYVSDIINDIGMGNGYTEFYDQFLSIMAGGQAAYTEDNSNPFSLFFGQSSEESDTDSSDWYEEDTADDYDYSNPLDNISGTLELSETGEGYSLTLSSSEWNNVVECRLALYIMDEDGYIDMGESQMEKPSSGSSLVLPYDTPWVTVNGANIAFYSEKQETLDDGSWYRYGYSPCYINNEEKQLVIGWNSENQGGYVVGYREIHDENAPAAKGTIPLKDGDTIEFAADCYTHEGEYSGQYTITEPMHYEDGNFTVSMETFENSYRAFFILTDIYQNNFFSETVEIE